MSNEELYLKQNVLMEPLVDQWYAWAHLISPGTAAMNISERHLRIMNSYIEAEFPICLVCAAPQPVSKRKGSEWAALLSPRPGHRFRANQVNVISANGLDMEMTLSIRFYPRVKSLGLLHQQAGPDYADKIVVPEIQSIVRNLCANFEPEEIYRTQPSLAQSMLAQASKRLEERFIVLEAILIKLIKLPATVQTAIESKLVAKEAAEEMKFKIEKEAGEKQRKLIEAEGIRLFNGKIQESLSDQVLRYKGIEALLEMAKFGKSNNFFFGGPDNLRYLMDLGSGATVKGATPLGTPVPSVTPVPRALPTGLPEPTP